MQYMAVNPQQIRRLRFDSMQLRELCFQIVLCRFFVGTDVMVQILQPVLSLNPCGNGCFTGKNIWFRDLIRMEAAPYPIAYPLIRNDTTGSL